MSDVSVSSLDVQPIPLNLSSQFSELREGRGKRLRPRAPFKRAQSQREQEVARLFLTDFFSVSKEEFVRKYCPCNPSCTPRPHDYLIRKALSRRARARWRARGRARRVYLAVNEWKSSPEHTQLRNRIQALAEDPDAMPDDFFIPSEEFVQLATDFTDSTIHEDYSESYTVTAPEDYSESYIMASRYAQINSGFCEEIMPSAEDILTEAAYIGNPKSLLLIPHSFPPHRGISKKTHRNLWRHLRSMIVRGSLEKVHGVKALEREAFRAYLTRRVKPVSRCVRLPLPLHTRPRPPTAPIAPPV